MSDADLLNQLRNMERAGRELRRSRLTSSGGSISDLSEHIRAENEALVPRSDTPVEESVSIFLLFFRGAFLQHPVYPWVPGPGGKTDVRSSKIIIESEFAADVLTDTDHQLPSIILSAGPTTDQEVATGSLAGGSFSRGERVLTGLLTGTMQAQIKAKLPVDGVRLSDGLKTLLRAGRLAELRRRGIHEVQNITGGGYTRQNALYNVETAGSTQSMTPVTWTYHYQWTLRETFRPGVFEMGQIVHQYLSIEDDPNAVDPLRDDRRIRHELNLGEEFIPLLKSDVLDPDTESE